MIDHSFPLFLEEIFRDYEGDTISILASMPGNEPLRTL